MKRWLLLVCVLIAFVASFCMGPPDLVSQLVYAVISATVCAVSVWISQKLLLKLAKGKRVVVVVSISWAVLVPCATHLAVYFLSA